METPPASLHPDLAGKVLTAGGILTGTQHSLVQGFTLTPDVAHQARIGALLKRWAGGGQLAAEEIAEVRMLHPDFASDTATAALPLPGEPPALPDKPGRLTSEQLDRWQALYDTDHRQLRRWHRHGEDKRDAVPFDHPARMPAWWARNMKHRVPPKILSAAATVRESEGGDGEPSAEKLQSVGAVAATGIGFDLEGSAVAEGEAVKQARQVVGAYFAQLKQAADLGKLDDVQLWQQRWEKAVESLRKQEKDDREWRKQLGLLMPRAEVETDVAAALTILKSMREQMTKSLLSELRARHPELPAGLVIDIEVTVEKIRGREDDVFRELPALKALPDVSERLAA